jgi:hypothetical protein
MSPLGIPPGSAKSAVKAVRSHLEAAGRQAEFEAAIDALASELRQCLNDYADQLTAGIDSTPSWTIP